MITVLTGVHDRADAFKLFCKNFYNLKPRPNVCIGGEEGNVCEKIARDYGFTYFYLKNRPLGKKINDVTQLACESAPTEYYFYTGMDDLVSQTMWNYYNKFKGQRLCLLDYYFYSIKLKKLIYWAGYKGRRQFQPIGAGELLSHRALASVGFRPLIDASFRWSESQLHQRMIENFIQTELMTVDAMGGIAVDLKDGKNANNFSLWTNSKIVPYSELVRRAPDIDEIIKQYGK